MNQIITSFTLPVYTSLSSFSPSVSSICILFFYSPPPPLFHHFSLRHLRALLLPSIVFLTCNTYLHLPLFHPFLLPSSSRSLSTLLIFSFHCLYPLFPSFLRFSSTIFTLFFHRPPRPIIFTSTSLFHHSLRLCYPYTRLSSITFPTCNTCPHVSLPTPSTRITCSYPLPLIFLFNLHLNLS
jgi:hypothetical protein